MTVLCAVLVLCGIMFLQQHRIKKIRIQYERQLAELGERGTVVFVTMQVGGQDCPGVFNL